MSSVTSSFGFRPFNQWKQCANCLGRGYFNISSTTMFAEYEACEVCKGKGGWFYYG